MPDALLPDAAALDARVRAVAKTALLDRGPDPAFDRVTALVRRLLDVPVALVSFVDRDRQFFVSQDGLAEPWASARETPLTHSFCQHVVEREAPLVIEDATQDPDLCSNLAIRDLDVVGYLGVPVRSPGGVVLGSLCAITSEPRAWGPDDVETMESLGAIVETEVALRTALREVKAEADERRETEGALRTNEDRLEFVLDVAGLGQWDLDVVTGDASRSDLHDRIFGYDARLPDWTYETFLAHVLPDDRGAVDAAFQEAVAQGTAWDFECRIRRADGAVRWIAVRGRSWLTDAGHPRRMIGTVADVTERKASQEALRQSETRFRRLADSAPALLWVTDADGQCTFLSRSWTEFTGQAEDEGLGVGWLAAVHPDDRARVEATFHAAVAAGDPFRVDYRLRRHDGVYRWSLDTGRPRHDAGGQAIGYVGSVIDIHDRKQAEARTGLLAGTGRLVERALDYEATLREIALLAVPEFSDWCAIDLLRADGSIEPVAITHPDPDKAAWGYELRERYPLALDAPSGVPHVIRTGEPEVYPTISGEALVAAAQDDEHLRLLRSVGFRSVIVVPMRAGGEVTGALTFVHAESDRHFEAADVEAAEEIARRAGAALEMARLHAALRDREARYRTLFDSIDVGFCVLEVIHEEGRAVDYRFAETNPAFVAQSGLEDPEGRTVRELMPEFPPERIAVYAAVAETGEAARFVRQVEETGRWYEIYATRIGRPGSAAVGVFSTDVTERRSAEQALRDSEERYRTLFESIDVGFCLLDILYDEAGEAVDYRFVETNPAFVEQTGLVDAEGRTAYELVPALERHWVELYAGVAETGEPARFVSGSDAMGRWFDVYGVRVGGDESRRVALLFTDITERRAAERALRLRDENKALLLGLLTGQREEADPAEILAVAAETLGRNLGAHRVGFFEVVDEDTIDFGRGPSWTDGTLEPLAGRFPAAGLGTGYLERIRAGEMHGLSDTLADPLTADSALPEIGVRSGIGAPILRGGRWVAGLYVHYAEPRRWTEAEVDVVRDVAEQTWNAVGRTRAEAALRESEARFRGTFENAAVGIAHVGLDGTWLRVNRRMSEIVGYTREEFLARTFQDITHPDDLGADLSQFERLLAGEIQSYHLEKRYVHRDGHTVWIHLTVAPERGPDGQIAYVISVVEDISEKKAAEAALRSLNEELEDRVAARTAEFERSNAELDQFAYVASHDLKAPLRAIDSLTTWIAEDTVDLLPAESARHLALLRGRVSRMEGLLDSLLLYSRAGRQHAEPEPVDTGTLVREAIALVAPPDHMTVEAVGPFPGVETARAPLELVVRNLVGNAIKHHDRPDGRVTVSAQVLGDWAEFTVADDGPGIAPAYQARVFGLFQTLRPRDEVEGSGMGLAIVKKTVEGRGGQVALESDGHRGTTFRFTWPLRARTLP